MPALFKSLVVLMLENRSFDHMLGFLQSDDYRIDGLNGTEMNPAADDGSPIRVSANARTAADLNPDPGHEFENVNVQIFGNREAHFTGPLMQGFVRDYARISGGADKATHVMKCFSADTLPVLSTLAKQFAICDHWFSSVPGSTIPNRLFAYGATSDGSLTQDVIAAPLQLKTIFEVMDDPNNPSDFKIYTHGQSVLMANLYLLKHQQCFHQFSDFKKDCLNNDLPAFALVEPRYDDNVAIGLYANSQHPDFPVDEGEKLIADVYDAIRKSPAWGSTLLLITYDEHGGIFDHVIPPKLTVDPRYLAVKASTSPTFAFDRLGVRVPAVFVSPAIKPGTIVSQRFDHCSIVATVRKLFCLGNAQKPFNWREAHAATFDGILNLEPDEVRTDDVELPQPYISGGANPPPSPAHAPTDLMMSMAKSVELAAGRVGVNLRMSTNDISTAQHATDFFDQAANALRVVEHE